MHQFACDGGDAFFQPGAATLPGFAAQFVERDRQFGRAITAEHVDILDRDEQLVPARIFQRHAIVLAFADRDGFKAQITPDPVLDMHDQIAACERLKFGEEGVGILALFLAPHEPVAKNVCFRQDFDRVAGEPGF